MSVWRQMADTPRLSMPRGVMAMLAARMASLMPGTMRSAMDVVASGVQSRGARPVPPAAVGAGAVTVQGGGWNVLTVQTGQQFLTPLAGAHENQGLLPVPVAAHE